MTKHAVISTRIPLPADQFEHAEKLLKVRDFRDDVRAAIQKHFPAAEGERSPEVEHSTVGDEPPTPAKVRRPRAVKPVAEVVPTPEPTPEPETVHRGRRAAAA